MNIPKIVLTGGPCAGKTTGMTYVAQKLSELGYYPLVVPETATMLISGGATPVGGILPVRIFQELVIGSMLDLERYFEKAAGAMGHQKPIILCDRGVMDARAYMPEDEFEDVVRGFGLDRRSMRDERYVGVFHLRSAALGAEEFYTKANNIARRESLEGAREADERTLTAWLGHPHVAVIDNEGKSFDEKLKLLFRKICRVIGEPEPLEIERKYLVGSVDLRALGVPHAEIVIEQCYVTPLLQDEGVSLRVRKRGQFGAYTYFETKKRDVRPGVRLETERFISADVYASLCANLEPGTVPLRKRRYCFVWQHQHFELDIFDSPHVRGLALLEIELADEHESVHLPPFIRVIKDVTDDPSFSNRALAVLR